MIVLPNQFLSLTLLCFRITFVSDSFRPRPAASEGFRVDTISPPAEFECPHCFHLMAEDEAEGGHCTECEWPLDRYPGSEAAEADYRRDIERGEP